tara:strand:- start:5212 stop:5436 length:225 start_codon:yes stop_codon:yes gene_type:complete
MTGILISKYLEMFPHIELIKRRPKMEKVNVTTLADGFTEYNVCENEFCENPYCTCNPCLCAPDNECLCCAGTPD